MEMEDKKKKANGMNGNEKPKHKKTKSSSTLDGQKRKTKRSESSQGLNDQSSRPPLLGEVSKSESFFSSSMVLDTAVIEQSKKDQAEINKWIPSPEVVLRWERVSKIVEIEIGTRFKKQILKKQILFDVAGCVRPGEVMALMGPSGSGKTTLLNILGGRTVVNVTGDITLNGETLVKSMKRKIAYVMQQDLFFDHLTVRQQLTYTALLRFPQKMSSSAKVSQVNKIIETLNIAKCADSPIMFLSGGERKRVNIGTELLTNPTLLLLDEPTSGLDSTTSVQLMKTLRLLAMQGKTILTSIHQPSSLVFQSFDKLLLLADGKPIYSGKPIGVLEYFSNLGYLSPPNYNPADFIMDLVNADDNPREKLIAKFEEIGKNNIDLPPQMKPRPVGERLIDLASQWPTTYFTQLTVLIRRNAKNAQSRLFTTLNFIQSIALAIIVGLCWFRMANTDATIADRSGFIFFVMTFWPFQTLFSGILTFPAERAVLMKERASGSYHLSAYFISKAISDAPIILLLPAVFLIISYWMANMNGYFPSFLAFMFAELICVWAAESVGLFIGAVFIDVRAALVFATVAMLGLMLVGGFFVRNLPIFIYWARYLSIFTYAFNACLVMEFQPSRVLECSTDPVVPLCQTQSTITGADALEFVGVHGVDAYYGFNVGILIFILISFRFLAYLALRFLNTKHFRQ